MNKPLIIDENFPTDHRSGFVAVIGRPNVGKSTLMNHFLGQKIAIVSSKPQTTRNRLLGILTLDKEQTPADLPPAQIIFVDTPGIHQPHHQLGKFLVETARESIPDAEVVLWLVDVSAPPTSEDQLVASWLHQAKQQGKLRKPVLLVLNKVDLLLQEVDSTAVFQPFIDLYPVDAWVAISAKRGDNQTELLAQIIDYLPLGPRFFPEEQVTDQQTRFIAAELIREAALNVLHQEVPHALAVGVTEFKQRTKQLTYINATIIVERDSQKKIVIGRQGQTLKQIGQLARVEIESLLEGHVYLDLWVKVRANWRKKEDDLRRLGYALN